MKRTSLAFLPLLALTACAGSVSSLSDLKDAHLAKQREARLVANAQLYSPACPAPAHYAAEHCGLSADSFSAEELARMNEASCRGADGRACEDDFSRKLIPLWRARYPRANLSQVAAWCGAEGKDCYNLNLQELQWMNSHNQAVLAELRAAHEAIREESRRTLATLRGPRREAPPARVGQAGDTAGRRTSSAANPKL